MEVSIKEPLAKVYCKFWLYSGNCKMPSKDCFTKVICKIGLLLEINSTVIMPPEGVRITASSDVPPLCVD